MGFTAFTLLLSVGLFAGMLLSLELGRRYGLRARAEDPEGWREGTTAVDSAVFALSGLLIAFTFQGAAARFDDRRKLIVVETNTIGTAYLRIDLLPPEVRPELRELFRRYVDSRLEVYRRLPDLESAEAALAKSAELQRDIWRRAVAGASMEGAAPSAAILLLGALNNMIDITTTRTMASRMHPPRVVFALLIGLALASALLAGYGMATGSSRRWIHRITFAAVTALAVNVISDYEYPRLGLIRVESFDQALVDLRAGMK